MFNARVSFTLNFHLTFLNTDVEIQCFEFENSKAMIKASNITSSKGVDFTNIIEIKGLKPDTKYYYKVLVNGNEVKHLKNLNFKTYPLSQSEFSIGLGGGAGYTPQYEKMWNTIDSHNLDAMLLMGDNVYIDIPPYNNIPIKGPIYPTIHSNGCAYI